MKRFNYHFTPYSPTNPSEITLTVRQIARAAIAEMGQLASASIAFGTFLNEITKDPNNFFIWSKRLGTVRETRTALSGLFGRYIARAYLEQYQDCRYFWPITSKTMVIPNGAGLRLRPTPKTSGDSPDWVCADRGTSIFIAEAKGSHNKSGFDPALGAAKKQVRRVQVVKNGVVLRVKQYSVATRWAIKGDPELDQPWLAVHDPEDGEREPTEDERERLHKGIAALHFSSLLEGMGYSDVAEAYRNYTGLPLKIDQSQKLLVSGIPEFDDVSGYVGLVTTAGLIPLAPEDLLAIPFMARRLRKMNALFLVVPEAPGAVGEKKSYEQHISYDDDDSFWETLTINPDGSILVPVRKVKLSRVELKLD